jgi:hypothetical protein
LRNIETSLWPIHYKPLPDELLSCWLVRLAHGLGLKVQTLCNLLFGNTHQVWNRDVDRTAPKWLVDELSLRTGTPSARAYGATLRPYEGVLYAQFKDSGVLPWIQTMKIYHRKREGFGLQFCGGCLAEKPLPYYRKRWRVAFNTICVKHRSMLHDRCPACGAGVAFHRMDVGRGSIFDPQSLAMCHACGFNLSQAPFVPIVSYDTEASAWHEKRCADLERQDGSPYIAIDLDEMRVFHQLVALLLTRYKTSRLREHICDQLGIADLAWASDRVSVESRSLTERHFLVQLGSWLMVDLDPRLRQAWRDKAVRYNHLLKDFDRVPHFYSEVVAEFRRGKSGRRPDRATRC